jgi:hypothetical protein
MAKMMKAAVVHEFGKPLRIEDVPIATPGRDDGPNQTVSELFLLTRLRRRIPNAPRQGFTAGRKGELSFPAGVRFSGAPELGRHDRNASTGPSR